MKPLSLKFEANILWATLYQLIVAFIMFWLTRFVFIGINAGLLDITPDKRAHMVLCGLIFDLSAFTLVNAPVIVLRFFPNKIFSNRFWVRVTTWYLVAVNIVLLTLSFIDAAYFPFTGCRLTLAELSSLMSDSATPGLFVAYLMEYRGLFLLWIGFVTVYVWLILRVKIIDVRIRGYVRVISFLLICVISFINVRGWNLKARPLGIGARLLYIDNPIHAEAVINTPFSFLHGKDIDESYRFYEEDEMLSIRNSLVYNGENIPDKRNIVLIVLESGGSIHSGVFSPIGKTPYSEAMTFMDSLANHSLINLNFYGSGRTSAQGITQLLVGVPYFRNNDSYFVNTRQAGLNIDTPARLLAKEGYSTSFYYGCEPSGFHIEETARAAGFEKLSNINDYGDKSDFDGVWGIWDKPMAEFVVKEIGETSEPFFTVWFTVSAHSPYYLPDNEDIADYTYKEAGPPQLMEYTDKAIRLFFDKARKQSWYYNTIFIITSDHGNRDYGDTVYSGDPYVANHVPLIIYTPDGSIAPGVITDEPMGQIDLAPTILDLAGYDKPHVSLGVSLFDDTRCHYALVKWFGQYYVYGNKYMVALDFSKNVTTVYDITATPYRKVEITDCDETEVRQMEAWSKALLQDYSDRVMRNQLFYKQ